jgi:hypothetical protein
LPTLLPSMFEAETFSDHPRMYKEKELHEYNYTCFTYVDSEVRMVGAETRRNIPYDENIMNSRFGSKLFRKAMLI